MISPVNSGQNFGREFSHFKREMNGRLNDMNKTISAALAEYRTSSQVEVTELKQDFCLFKKCIDGIVRPLEDKSVSACKNKKISSELSIRIFPRSLGSCISYFYKSGSSQVAA